MEFDGANLIHCYFEESAYSDLNRVNSIKTLLRRENDIFKLNMDETQVYHMEWFGLNRPADQTTRTITEE